MRSLRHRKSASSKIDESIKDESVVTNLDDVDDQSPEVASISGNPTTAEAVAIAVAIDALWPRPTVEENVVSTAANVWKFANRWWHGSRVVSRTRPRRPR